MALYLRGNNIAVNSGIPIVMEGIDTTDATAKASDILKGKTAYVNDKKITGTSTFDADTKDATATAADILLGKTAYVNGQKLEGLAQDNKAPYAWGKYNASYEPIMVGEHRGVEYIHYEYGASWDGLYDTTDFISATIDFALDNPEDGGYLITGSNGDLLVSVESGYLIADIRGNEVLNIEIDN